MMSPLMRARTVSMSVSPGFWTTLMKLLGKNIHIVVSPYLGRLSQAPAATP